MAVGDGGFSTKPMGFDKNEVNEYISNLRKKMNEIEADKRVNDEKTRAAVKTAEEADAKIQALKNEYEQKMSELEEQIKLERKKAEAVEIQLDEAKRKLKQSSSNVAANASANANAAEIIDNANAKAREIVEKAKKTASEMLSAGSVRGGMSDEFMAVLKRFTETVSEGLREVNSKAAELANAPAPEIPDFSEYTAPRAEVARPEPPKAAERPAPKADVDMGGDLFSTDMDMGGNDGMDMFDMGSLDNSDSDMDLSGFGEDIKPLDPQKPKHEVVEGFDLSNAGKPAPQEDDVSEIEPLDEKRGGAKPDDEFARDLIVQTVPSSALSESLDEDLLAEVKEREEAFAVQPSDGMDDFDMGGMDMGSSGDSGIDAMNALLGQMGAALESAGGNASDDFELDNSDNSAEDDSSNSAPNPWADLQAQLNAMEQSGSIADEPAAEEPSAPAASDDRKVPDADDSSIWNFGGDSSGDSSDDDMSADLFGSF